MHKIFLELNSENVVINKLVGDDSIASRPNHIEYASSMGVGRHGSLYNSDTNTFTPPIQLEGNMEIPKLEDIQTENYPVTFSFTENLLDSFDSSSIEIKFGFITEFNKDDNQLQFLVSPETTSQDSGPFYDTTVILGMEDMFDGSIKRVDIEPHYSKFSLRFSSSMDA